LAIDIATNATFKMLGLLKIGQIKKIS